MNQYYVHSYSEQADTVPTRKVGSSSIFGLSDQHTGFKGFTISAGIKNLLDRDPPHSRQSQSFQVGYDRHCSGRQPNALER